MVASLTHHTFIRNQADRHMQPNIGQPSSGEFKPA